MTTTFGNTKPTTKYDQIFCHPSRVISFVNEENSTSIPIDKPNIKKRNLDGNSKGKTIESLMKCFVTSTHTLRDSTKEEDEAMSALSDSLSMPLDYRIDWSEHSDYEEDIIQSVKSLENNEPEFNKCFKSCPSQAITIDDSVDPFDVQIDERDTTGKEIPLIITTDNYQNIWYENSYVCDQLDNDDSIEPCRKRMRTF